VPVETGIEPRHEDVAKRLRIGKNAIE
jgi:hypothetical protein